MSIASGAQNGPGSIELGAQPGAARQGQRAVAHPLRAAGLARAERYLRDFGLTTAAQDPGNLYMRGTGTLPYIYHAVRGPKARFLGIAFGVPAQEDLKKLAEVAGRPIENSTAPGGGSFVRLRDPDGVAVDVYHGFTPSSPHPLRPAISHNAPNNIVRVNSTQRPALEPPQVTKLGHLVLEAIDFDASARWYMDTLGFIPSDVMCLPDGTPSPASIASDPGGDDPVITTHCSSRRELEFGVDHAAFEVVDLDAVEMGQQVMYANKYRHAWGVGRHLLGSQNLRLLARPMGAEARALRRWRPLRCLPTP